jgi:hypothetical protein
LRSAGGCSSRSRVLCAATLVPPAEPETPWRLLDPTKPVGPCHPQRRSGFRDPGHPLLRPTVDSKTAAPYDTPHDRAPDCSLALGGSSNHERCTLG